LGLSSKAGSPWGVVATVMVGTLLVGLDRTVVNLALPDIISDFDVTVPTASWLGTGYIIADAVFIPVFGKLGDMVGARRVYMWGMWGFLVTSVLCGLAPSFGFLVVLRVLQGLVGAAVFPTSLALITHAFTDPGERARAFGIWSASFAVSIALGPLVGGPLIDNFSWRWIFLINFPITVLGMVMVVLLIKKQKEKIQLRAFDWQGAALLALPLTALTLVLERGPEWGWGSPGAFLCYAVVPLGTAWFVAWENHAPDPMVRLTMLRHRTLTVSLAVSFVAFIGMVGSMFLMPVFAQSMLGYDATGSGFLLLPMSATLMIASAFSARLTANLPMRVVVSGSFLTASIGLFLLSGIDARTTWLELSMPLVVMAIGISSSFPSLTTAATASVDISEAGVASSLLNLSRNMGAAVGIALVATLSSNLFDINVFDLSKGTTIDNPAMAQSIAPLIAVKAQIAAYGSGFLVGGLVMVAAGLGALFLGKSRVADITAGPAAPH
jgi:EmrB/QacA subfamily drug resistance transporter